MQKGYVESFNGKLRDECLNEDIFETLAEARVLVESWNKRVRNTSWLSPGEVLFPLFKLGVR